MAIDFTTEQQRVIDAPIEDILVSAAAGSGKTTVLVQRIIEKIISGEYSIDQILVVTFTRDAASNMQKKIATALKTRIAELRTDDASNQETIRRLRNELNKLPNSYIQTIDSFCTRVIKEKSHVCADLKEMKLVESGASVLSENELDLIMLQAATRAIDESYTDEVDPVFEELTHMFGDGRNDNRLAECLVSIYKKLRSTPDYISTCEKIIADRHRDDEAGVIRGLRQIVDRVIELFSFADDRALEALTEYADMVTFATKEAADEAKRQQYIDLAQRVHAYTSMLVKAYRAGEDPRKIWEMIRTEASIIGNPGDSYPTLPSAKATDPSEMIEFRMRFGPFAAVILFLKPILGISKAPNGYNGVVEQYALGDEISKLLMRTPEEFLELQKKRTALTEVFVGLIKSMDEDYAQMKARVHGMDFPDQEHLAKLILAADEAGEYYRNKFREIYIDEYQDNSALQDAIIEQFCRKDGNGNVFRVGDVKQSIYKFRYADPGQFIRKGDELRDPSTRGELFTLNCNHRSTGAVLDFCNVLFEQLMSRKATEIEYNEEHKLNYPGAKAGGPLPRAVLVDNHGAAKTNVTIDGKLHYRTVREEAVRREIEHYMSIGVTAKDICVLTRSRNAAALISSYLEGQGLPAFYADELNIFADGSIHGICNVIIAAANERRDEYLAGVLLSGYRISNFTIDEMATIHLFADMRDGGDYCLIDKLRLFIAEGPKDGEAGELRLHVEAFLDWFGNLRADMVITDIGMLVDRIYRDTGVCAGSVADAEKFYLFKQWLMSNFMRFGSDIATVALRLEEMKIKLTNDATVRGEVEHDERIKCMTMHSSKGLEFKCVIVAELGKNDPGKNDGKFAYDKEMGFITEDYSEAELSTYTSIESLARSYADRLADISEDMRLLYVAMTRAKEYLSVMVEADLTIPEEDPEKKGKKSNSGGAVGKMIRSILRQPDVAVSRQHWLLCSGRMIDGYLAAILRLSGAERLLDRLNICYNAGAYDGMVVPIDFDGVECVIYDDIPVTGQMDESDITAGDDEDPGEGDDYGSTSGGNEENMVDEITDRREFNGELFTEGKDEYGMPIFPPYPHSESSTIPFKVSVSQITEAGIGALHPINLNVYDFDHYVDQMNGDVGENSREMGTFAHRLLRFMDLSRAVDEDGFRKEIDKLVDLKVISARDIARAEKFKDDIIRFANTDLGKRLAEAEKAGKAEYEKPLVFETPVGGSDYALAQGMIDCIFYEEDGAVILDYKTDTMYGIEDSVDARRMEAIERHGIQVDCYAAAVESAGIHVNEKYLVLLRFGEAVEL